MIGGFFQRSALLLRVFVASASIANLVAQAQAAELTAIYSNGMEVPLTAAGYTATGNTVSFTLNYAPTPGTQLTVVNNTGLDFIQGVFDNLDNGAAVNLSYNGTTYSFVAWYYGGDGNNDLVLLWRDTGLAAWGKNNVGQLGDGNKKQRNVPRATDQGGVLAGKTIVQVAQGSFHTLALTSEGKVYSWGENARGELGNKTNTSQSVPVAVDTTSGSALFGKTVVAIAASGHPYFGPAAHSLALCSDGSLAAWGYNEYGQLGNSTTTNQNKPVPVSTDGGSALAGKNVVSIAAGGFHTLALCSDGTVATWGWIYQSSIRTTPVAVSTVSGVSALFGKTVTKIAAGNSSNLALCSDGTMASWLFDAPEPVDMSGPLAGKTVTMIASGDSHKLVLCSDGTLAAWGKNAFGQLGDNTTTQRLTPVAVNQSGVLNGKIPISIAAGREHSMVLCSDGSLAAWGLNVSGQLGNNTTTNSTAPVLVSTAPGASVLAGKQVSRIAKSMSFSDHALAIYGLQNTQVAVEHPLRNTLVDGASVDFGATSLTGEGKEIIFTIRNTGPELLAWINTTIEGAHAAEFSIPRRASYPVMPGDSITLPIRCSPIASGQRAATVRFSFSGQENAVQFHLTSTGTTGSSLNATYLTGSEVPLTTAGFNATGNTVILALNYAPTPGTQLMVVNNTSLDFITGVFNNLPNGEAVDIEFNGKAYPFVAWYYGGDGNDLVLLWRETSLAAWGKNANGQLGNNTVTALNVPAAVDQSGALAGKTIVQVARGSEHSLALTTEGRVYSWGSNSTGQLGNNTTVTSLMPVAVSTSAANSALSNKFVVAIAAGGSHSIALCSDGTVVAWGANTSGQLGDFSNTQRNAPTNVWSYSANNPLAKNKATAIAAGTSYSLALCSDGSLAAWGSNVNGQLGDGTTSSSNVPIAVNTDSGTSALFGKWVSAIAAGSSHNLALCTDGTLASFGGNSSGQLGDGTTVNRNSPVLVQADNPSSAIYGKVVSAIAAGSSHSLALCSDGMVVAFGSNNSGQLGNGTTIQSSLPGTVSTDRGISALFGKWVSAISAGGTHNLVLCSDGSLAAWGSNSNGQLGDGSASQRPLPVAVKATAGASALAGKNIHALQRSGGIPTHTMVIHSSHLPRATIESPAGHELTNGAEIDFRQQIIGSVMERTLIIKNTGLGVLSGLSASIAGAPDSGFSVSSHPLGIVAPGGVTILKVLFVPPSEGNHTAVLRVVSNDVDNSPFDIMLSGVSAVSSELVAGYSTGAEVPLMTEGFTATGNTVSISLNFAPKPGTQLMLVNNTSLDFIQGVFDNLANGQEVDLHFNGLAYPFVAWYYGGNGNNDLVLLWRETGLAAWGANFSSQIGEINASERTTPVRVDQSGVLAGKTIVQMVRGAQHSLALTTEGKVYAWGGNATGQLGNNTLTMQTHPVEVDVTSGVSALFGKTVIALAAGTYHSLALCSDGSVAAWGYNLNGQLGDTTTTLRAAPVLVNEADGTSALFGKTVVSLAAGASHSLALCSDGGVVSWGNNTEGQLGDNSLAQRNSPVEVNSTNGTSSLYGKTVISLAAGTSHSLALCSDGSVAAWGINTSGQIGDTTYTQRLVPTEVNRSYATSALFGKFVTGIAAGDSHNLALCSDGLVAAWGWNLYGQLGDASMNDSLVPVGVNTSNGSSALFGKTVMSVSTGRTHSLAHCHDGTVVSWGHNVFGQLGDSSTSQRIVPVAVNTIKNTSVLAGRPVISLGVSDSSSHHSMAIWALMPEIALEDSNGAILANSDQVNFGTIDLVSASIEESFTIRNAGEAQLTNLAIAIKGPNASEFSFTANPDFQVAPDGSTPFTVRFAPAGTGLRTATLRITSNAHDENPFEISLLGAATLSGYRMSVGDSAEINLGFLLQNPGETLRVLGLPAGLKLIPGPPPRITGTALGMPGSKGVQIQVLQGSKVVRTLPFDLAVKPYAPGGGYELILENGETTVGKVKITITSPTAKSPYPAYTATLHRLGEPRRSAKGSFTAGAPPQTIPIFFPLYQKTYPAVTFDLVLQGDSTLATATTNPISEVTARGFRLASTGSILGGNPLMTLALPPAMPGERITIPGGIGYATGSVNSKALIPLSGLLGDARPFTASLCLSQTNQAVVWLTPYADKTSYLGGIIDIGDLGIPGRGAPTESAVTGLKWRVYPDAKSKAYPAGFGPLDLTASTSRWHPQTPAEALAQSLGLDFRNVYARYLAPTSDILSSHWSLRDNFTFLPLFPADAVPLSGRAIGRKGTFSGTLKLPAPAASSPMSGVLLQDEAFGKRIGQGLIKVPITSPVKGSFQTMGIELEN